VEQGIYTISLASKLYMGLGANHEGVQLQPLNLVAPWSVRVHPTVGLPWYTLGYGREYARFGQSPIILSGIFYGDQEFRIRFDSLGGDFWAINNHDETLVFTFFNDDNPNSMVTPFKWNGAPP